MNDKKSLHNEQGLLLRIAAGDEQAYRQVFDQYWDPIFANALRFTKSPEHARDLAQEVFIRIWMNREKLAHVTAFDAYLYTITRNLFRNELRKKVLTTENMDYLRAYLQERVLNAQERLEYKEMESAVNKAIAGLPEQLQTVFRLSRFEGLTHEQIAERMNISVVTSKTYMVRCLLKIRGSLGIKAGKLGVLLLLLARF